ncbi:alpha/beta hydrolase [Enterococcus dongliensis]|uniref:alpha/beta hydrolase n=1 Tax=Enterococcus dongliensis TaxID=2559925 RepID=UPI00288D6385|nr:alpha/beta hydrolase [Enterococcus dongliensis]MDT2613305.1 alpha/beta hydrolase [Enterococcus dongliensis]
MPNYLFSKDSRKLLVYLAGGGFVLPISGLHWDYLDMITKETDTDLLVLNYPLAPAHNVDDVMQFVNSAILRYQDLYDTVTLMGDSAGGNIVLGYSQSSYNKDKMIKNIIALSPFVDFSLKNKAINTVAQQYRGNHEITNPLISPINGNYNDLNVLIISGTRDITNPDTQLLAERNSTVKYIQQKNMPHIFMLYMIPESEKPNQIIIDMINEL